MREHDIHFKGERDIKEIFWHDMTLQEYKDAVEAFEDLEDAQKEGASVWTLLEKESSEYNNGKIFISWVIVFIMKSFIKYKMKKFAKKYPEYIL